MRAFKHIAVFAFSLFSLFGYGQVKFYAQGPTSSAVGADYKIVFVIENADASNFKAPSFEGFQILSGPNQSSSYQNINGKITNSLSVYYYLRPLEEGTLSIKPASVIIDGERMYTDDFEVLVGPSIQASNANNSNQSGNSSQLNQNNPATADEWKEQAKDNLFVRLYTDNQQPYVGEQIFVYAKFYQRINTYGSQITAYPEFKGFWKQDIEVSDYEPVIEEYEGVQYQTFLIAKYALFPLKEGKYTIDPVKMTSILLISVPKVMNYWGMKVQTMDYEQVEYDFASNPLLIDAKPLPTTNKPLDFIGAVGDFELQTSVDSAELSLGSPLHFKAKISGVGNIMSIQEPKLKFPRQLEVYDPETKESISKQSNWVKGSKTYDYILVPQRPGTYTIPPVQFSYFDTKEKRYKTLSSSPIEVKVKGEMPTIVKEEEIEDEYVDPYELHDIYASYTKTAKSNFYSSWKYQLSLASPFMLYFLFLFGARLKEEFQPDAIALKNKRALEEGQKRLKKAKVYLDQQKQEAFYNEIFDAFNGYVADKFNIEQASLSKEYVLEKFEEKKISSHLAEQFIQVLSNSEEALYSPQAYGKMQDDYDTAIQWIVKIEHEVS